MADVSSCGHRPIKRLSVYSWAHRRSVHDGMIMDLAVLLVRCAYKQVSGAQKAIGTLEAKLLSHP